jgi:hypothetical protein
MATYLGTHGSRIQNYTTDPDNPNTGEVWYNETANTLKFQYPNTFSQGSWATGGNLNTARGYLSGANNAPQTTALVFGGTEPPPRGALTELYNGSNWTETTDLNTARSSLGGAGISTSVLMDQTGLKLEI